MKSNEVLNDMSEKLKLFSKNKGITFQQPAMMRVTQRATESNALVSHGRGVKRAESDALLMRSAGYSYSGMLMAVQEHENTHNFSYDFHNSAIHSIDENQLQQLNSSSVKSNEASENMSNK